MNSLENFSIIAAFANLMSLAGNIFWTWKINGMRAHGEMIAYWKEECEKRDNQIKDMNEKLGDMIKRKNEMKIQYQNQMALNKRLEGELKTYRTLHDKLRFDYK